MKEIPLSQFGKNRGKYFAIVDDEDYDKLNKVRWSVCKTKTNMYALWRQTNGKSSYMHRVIMGLTHEDTTQIDHIDHNGLNNQKYNLRDATHSQNMKNRRAAGISKYLGVSLNNGFWKAGIKVNGVVKYLGCFKNEDDAAKAYNDAATIIHGEFANLNQI